MVHQIFGLLLLATSTLALPFGRESWDDDEMNSGDFGCIPGLYAMGCSPRIRGCREDGSEFELTCPFSLWFNEESQSCVPQSDVPMCRSKRDVSAIASSGYLSNDFCTGLQDGFHPVSECSSSISRCINGTASIFECPAGQVFTKGKCINMDEATHCQMRSDTDECAADGLFEIDTCSPLFMACGAGISHIMTCPWPLVFDAENQICNYDYQVAGCPVKPNTMCPSDGFYSYKNCSDTFYACTGDSVQPMHCPASLAFDEQHQRCDYPSVVPECGSDGSGSGSGEAKDDGSGQSSGDGNGEGSGNDGFCLDRPDGFYAEGCSSTLIGCSNGLAYNLRCPANLAFDEKRTRCEYREALEICHENGSGEVSPGSSGEGSALSPAEGSTMSYTEALTGSSVGESTESSTENTSTPSEEGSAVSYSDALIGSTESPGENTSTTSGEGSAVSSAEDSVMSYTEALTGSSVGESTESSTENTSTTSGEGSAVSYTDGLNGSSDLLNDEGLVPSDHMYNL